MGSIQSKAIQFAPRFVFLFLVPLLIAFLQIYKFFFFPNCFAFDPADDANHTFVNLFAARWELITGHLPLMNLFNNFGTPIAGDMLTYPFSPLSLTYIFATGPLAMTINRFLATFLTVLLGTIYFRKTFSYPIAALCGVIVMLMPSFLWHSAHHHYQLAVALFYLLLLVSEWFLARPRLGRALALYATLVFAHLSVSFHLYALYLPFLVGNLVLTANSRRPAIVLLAAYLGGCLFYYPDTFTFLSSIAASGRVHQCYGSATYHMLHQMLPGFVGRGLEDWAHAPYHFSVPLIVLFFFGWGARKTSPPHLRNLFWKALFLGVLPSTIAMGLIYVSPLWCAIPLVRSTDISRVFWLSSLFLMFPVGAGIQALARGKIPFTKMRSAFFLALFCLFLFFPWHWGGVPFLSKATTFVLVGALFWALKKTKRTSLSTTEAGGLVIGLALLLLIAQATEAIQQLGLFENANPEAGRYAGAERAEFEPKSLLGELSRGSRLATSQISYLGHDLKSIPLGFYGSAGRSVLQNKPFGEWLLRQGVIEEDSLPLAYHFKGPFDPEKLARLGIRYVLIDAAAAPGNVTHWKKIASAETDFNFPYQKPRRYTLSVYENPVRVGLVYLDNGKQIRPLGLSDLSPHQFRVSLPDLATPQEVVATFLFLPGWRALVDRRARELRRRADGLLRILVRKGDREVVFVYDRYHWWDILIGFISGILLLFSSLILSRRFI